jgi:hypothetical protein
MPNSTPQDPSDRTALLQPKVTISEEQHAANLEATFKNYSEDDIIKPQESAKRMTFAQVDAVLQKIARTKEISSKTAAIAVAALFRKGAANAGAPDSMEVELRCPEKKTDCIITRYDITMALQPIVGHKTVRKLAEALAPTMLEANLQNIKLNPTKDLKGDLSNRINRKLILRKETPLTREEEICCATYAQWMPNLNELASSTRLKALLDEDLNARRKKKNKPGQSKTPQTAKTDKKDK